MNLEILIKDNMIKFSADWFWYVLVLIWLVSGIVSHGLNIYRHYLERKGGNVR